MNVWKAGGVLTVAFTLVSALIGVPHVEMEQVVICVCKTQNGTISL